MANEVKTECVTLYYVSYNTGNGWDTTPRRTTKQEAARDWWNKLNELGLSRFQSTLVTEKHYQQVGVKI